MTLSVLIIFGLASQHAQAYSDDWVMGFHDSRHTGHTSEVVTPPLTVAWTWTDTYTYDNGNGGKFHPQPAFWLPIYYSGKVCFQGGLNANRVFCLNPADGTKIWESDNSGYTASGTYLFQFDNYPAVAAGRLIYVSSDFTATVDALTGLDYHNLYNVDGGWPAGGVASWNGFAYEQFIRYDDRPLPSEQFSIIPNPSTFAGIVGSYQEPDNVTTFTDPFFRVPAVDGGVAYANFLGRLEAWDALTHMPLWVWGSSNYGSSPAVANGVVYFYTVPTSKLVALRASPTGTVSTLWSAGIQGAKSPIVSDGVVYVGSSDNNFYALDAATGATKWSFATKAPFTSYQIPAISGDLIYVPGADGILYILQKSTGLEAGRYSGTAAWGPLVIGGGKVYASDLTNKFYAFQPQTAAIAPSETSVSLSRATNNQAMTVNLTGSGFFAGGSASAVQSIVLDNAAGTVLTGYTVTGDQAITGVVVPAGILPGIYHIKVRTSVGSTANEPVFEVAAANSNLISILGQSPGLYGTGTQTGYQRHLVRTSNGTLIAVYIGPQGANSRPATYNISHDGGLTWTGQAQLVDAIIWAPSSSVWVDKQDHLNVSYLIGYHQALAKFAVGQSDLLSLDPGFPVVASSPDVLAQTGPLVSESGGRLWVAYKITTQYDPPGSVIALYSDDGGLTWTRTPQITAAGSSPALILYQDKPAAIYSENGFLVWAAWNGQQWGATQILPGAITGVQQSPSAVVTSNGQVQIAYVTATGGVNYVGYSGSAWSAPQTLDPAGNSPSLTTDGTSLWCFYGNSTGDLAYRRTNNGQWNPAVAVTSDGNSNTSPANLTLSPDARIPIIWTSGASTSGYVVKSAVIPGDGGAAPLSAALGITETPTGNFTQGQSGASYTVTVSNNTSAGPSSGTVTVTDTTPVGLTLVSMGGSGWGCSGNTCTRTDVLNASLSYPAITVTVNVAPTAPSAVTNQVTVSGGNSAPASASNTAVVVVTPVLRILENHSGDFCQGQTAAAYTATVSNQAGAGPTSGTVTVTGTTPVGLTLVSMGGSGWGCSGNTCARTDVLNAGASYPAITVTVNVAASAPSAVTNQASVTGGNSAPASSSDTTVVTSVPGILPASAAFVNTDTKTQGSWKSVYGSQGANVIGDSASYPSYVTVTPSANSYWVWAATTTNVRAPLKLSSTTVRAAGCWYSSGVFTIDLNFTDGQTHQVALYTLDFDNLGRSEKIDILDANGAVLDTRPVSSFVGGQYLVWNLSGHVKVRVTNTTPASNAVISGLFFGPGSVVPPSPILSILETHSGTFSQGQTGAVYTATVSNQAGGPTSGTVTVTGTTPVGLTLVSMAGSGWGCSGNTCTRADVLNAGAGYPTITVTVNVAASAPSAVTNQVNVTGGNSAPANASDTAVVVTSPILSISETHSGAFSQGQAGAAYTATVSNQAGAGPTSGTVTVTGTTPVGLTLVSMGGSGWGCSGNTCTRTDVLNAGASYPAITVTVNVAASAPSAVTNQVSVSGGNSAAASASDTAVVTSVLGILPASDAFVKTDTTTQGSWKSVYGSQGANVIGDSASYPSYVTVTPSANSYWVWAATTTNVRAPLKLSSTTARVAGCWYSSGVFTIDLNFTDGQTHQVTLYTLDFDNLGRSEKIDIVDANGAVLDTRPVASFTGGQYLVWNLSGHVKVRVTNTTPASNAVVSGLFFGPPA